MSNKENKSNNIRKENSAFNSLKAILNNHGFEEYNET